MHGYYIPNLDPRLKYKIKASPNSSLQILKYSDFYWGESTWKTLEDLGLW